MKYYSSFLFALAYPKHFLKYPLPDG